MVDKTRQVDPGKLTAYERWELPNIGDQSQRSHKLSNTASQKVKPPTAQDIENIRKQAYDAGFEEGRKSGQEQGHEEGLVSGKETGHKLGLEQGLADGQAQINKALANLEVLLAELVAPLTKQQALVEEAMLNVSMAVARTVIHRELSLDSSSIQQAIHSILSDLPKVDKGFSLRINPQDEVYVQPILDQYDSAIVLKLDETITPGGCLLSSSSQLIDYTIEKRFQKTVQGMLNVALQANTEQSVEVPSSISALSEYPSDTLEEYENSDPVIEAGAIASADGEPTSDEIDQAAEEIQQVVDDTDPDADADSDSVSPPEETDHDK